MLRMLRQTAIHDLSVFLKNLSQSSSVFRRHRLSILILAFVSVGPPEMNGDVLESLLAQCALANSDLTPRSFFVASLEEHEASEQCMPAMRGATLLRVDEHPGPS